MLGLGRDKALAVERSAWEKESMLAEVSGWGGREGRGWRRGEVEDGEDVGRMIYMFSQ